MLGYCSHATNHQGYRFHKCHAASDDRVTNTYFFLILERLFLLLVFTEAKLIEACLQLSERKQVFKEWHLFLLLFLVFNFKVILGKTLPGHHQEVIEPVKPPFHSTEDQCLVD